MKGFKARGKRVSNYLVEAVEELEPVRFATPTEPVAPSTAEEPEEPEATEEEQSDADLLDEITGQMKLFDK